MAKTLQELLASRSPESQVRIQKMADELKLENHLLMGLFKSNGKR